MKQAWANHGTKIIGGLVTLAGAVGTIDPNLVLALASHFGASTPAAAVMITGILTFLRGVSNGCKTAPDTKINSHLLITVMAVLIAFSALSGCASLERTPNASALVVQYATAKIVEQGKTADERLARATRIKAIADEARGWLAGEGVTIAFLEQAARARVAKLNLETSDLILVNALIQTAVEDLQAKVGAGVIPPDQLVTVNQLLGWIEQAAALYGA